MLIPEILVRNRIDKVSTTSFGILQFMVGVIILLGFFPTAPSLEATLLSTAVYAWGLLLVLGTPLLILGRFKGYLRLEAAGCFATAMAHSVYISALLINNFESAVAAALFLSAFAISYGYRGYSLNKLANRGPKVGWTDADDILS